MTDTHFFKPNAAVEAEPFHYKGCMLDNIYLQNGFKVTEIDGEKHTSIEDLDSLHQAIGLHIVLERKAPSGKELRFLRTEMRMTQAELAQVLGVTDQSVARWEKEQFESKGGALAALRMIYIVSLLTEEERAELLASIVSRLKDLAEMDENSENIVLMHSGDRWSGLKNAA